MLKKAGRDATETMAEMVGENFFLGVDPKLLAMQFATTALYDFLQGDTIDSVMTMCEDSYNETEDTVTGTFDAYVEKNGDALSLMMWIRKMMPCGHTMVSLLLTGRASRISSM